MLVDTDSIHPFRPERSPRLAKARGEGLIESKGAVNVSQGFLVAFHRAIRQVATTNRPGICRVEGNGAVKISQLSSYLSIC